MNHLKTGILSIACISAVGTTSPSAAQGMGQGGWHVSQKADPLTDVTVTRGAREYNGPQYSVQVEVICRGGKLSYSFSTYDASDGSPAPLKVNYLGELSYYAYALRLDAEKAMTRTKPVLFEKYNNSFSFDSSESKEVAQAQRVVMKFDLKSGETLITIDQTDPRLRFVLSQCVKLEGPGTIRRRLAEEKRKQEQAAQQEADKKAAAVAAEKAEHQKYNVPLAGLNFRSQGSCSFEEYGQVSHRKCEFWFPSPQPETADRMVVIKKSNDPSTNVDYSYRFNMSGDLAYVTESLPDGANESRFQLKSDRGCWAGENARRPIRICLRPRMPKFQPG